MISFNIDSDIKKSETLPSEFYLENQYFKFCKEFLFPSSWQLITDVQNLDKNNIYPFCFLEDFIDEPLILDELIAFIFIWIAVIIYLNELRKE